MRKSYRGFDVNGHIYLDAKSLYQIELEELFYECIHICAYCFLSWLLESEVLLVFYFAYQSGVWVC